MTIERKWKRRLAWAAALLAGLGLAGGIFAWHHLFRAHPQPSWITSDPELDFKYGSLGAEEDKGLPYWIFVVLPRVFPEYLPGPGGYAALGLPWEEGREVPVGFAKRRVGFDRVGNNCAICHATSYRLTHDETPRVVVPGGSHTTDLQGLLRFFTACAEDPRFNAGTLLNAIDQAYPLSWSERLLYRFAIIPLTRKALLEQGASFAWMEDFPAWGPGRDDLNLAKFTFVGLDPASSRTSGNADFPPMWNLGPRLDKLDWTWDGQSQTLRSQVLDSALGLGARYDHRLETKVEELIGWMAEVRPPAYPYPVDAALAAAGAEVFGEHCASCHATDRPSRMGTVIPIDEVGTDRQRLDTMTRETAEGINRLVAGLGVERQDVIKTGGYVAVPLDGLWLRGPYLHNGSVPSVRALLEPPELRPRTFWRGYDLVAAGGLGFVSERCPSADFRADQRLRPCVPRHLGWRHDVAVDGNGNGGHRFGVELPDERKVALLEYLKTL